MTQPFLIDPANRAFLAGRRLWPAAPSLLAIFFSALMFAVGALPGAHIWRERLLHRQLDHSGTHTNAVVTDRRVVRDEDGDSYRISYRFSAAGASFDKSEHISEADYDRFATEPTIPARYLASDPAGTARAGSRPGALQLLLFSLFSGCWLLVTGTVLASFVATRARARRLAQAPKLHGHITRASAKKDSDGDSVLELDYQVLSPRTGRALVGHDRRTRNDLSTTPSAGTPLVVLYDSDDDFLAL